MSTLLITNAAFLMAFGWIFACNANLVNNSVLNQFGCQSIIFPCACYLSILRGRLTKFQIAVCICIGGCLSWHVFCSFKNSWPTWLIITKGFLPRDFDFRLCLDVVINYY
ncbi:hypothetical protein PTKIN_Ptkin13bG0284300 [Pterospermum kingtungense]